MDFEKEATVMIMKFKPGDRVTVIRLPAAIAYADKCHLLGQAYLPGRGCNCRDPIDFSAQGCVRAIDNGFVAVRWDNPRYGEYWYSAGYLMPLCSGGF